jgi:NhaA family Na+:H+ antiporter
MDQARPTRLDPPVDPARDHVLGNADAELTLVEYGSYACPYCRAAHEVIADLRDRFGDRMRYVFRQRPIPGVENADRAAEVVECAAATTGRFWDVHDALMSRGPRFQPGELDGIAADFGLPPVEDGPRPAYRKAAERVREDVESARRSGVLVTPTFFINGRRYAGAWDESALAEAMLGSLGHRIQTAALDFVRWGPSTGLLLLLATVAAILLVNSPAGPAFEAFWHSSVGLQADGGAFSLPLVDWVNHGLLTVFFLVVGLEIKREFTVGHLATRRVAALPLAAALGGMLAPALLYLAVVPDGPLGAGWGIPIATDTAFAVALIVLLGDRVPVALRVFLTAAVIVDDLVVIAIIAFFYSGGVDLGWLAAAGGVTSLLLLVNYGGVYRALPYAMLGVALWVCLHEGGLHATLAGVVLAAVIPTRPPANLRALLAQAEMVVTTESRRASGETVMRHGPSEPALEALNAIHDRIESPADKLLRSVQPWSSYLVLPVFALANAGVAWSLDVVAAHGTLVLAIVLGLAVGKPVGILAAAWLATRVGLAEKPADYGWRQLAGAGAMAGIGFTMSLFIAGEAFPDPDDFAAAKIAIFLASLVAGILGVLILWKRTGESGGAAADVRAAAEVGQGTPVAAGG